jgi:hypothetical protein
VPGFVAAQVVGLGIGVGLLPLYPDVQQAADQVVVAHDRAEPADNRSVRVP